MDTLRGFENERSDGETDEAIGGGDETVAVIGTDERRMHVRAYNHWVSLLQGRPYPAIGDLDPSSIVDFGPHSVLIDFTKSIDDPAIAFLGRALREECDIDHSITRIADVPGRSLLSRLTDHYLQIIANRAPIGFEAEFVGIRGHVTLYRGILMPFSSNGETIDFIYGVINWKEMVDAATQAKLDAEVDAAVRSAPKPQPSAPIWADGPSAGVETPGAPADLDADNLDARLTLARASASAAASADSRSRTFLYRAIGLAHDFAIATQEDPEGYAALLAEAGIKAQARAPMTPIAKLVFGSSYDKTRLTEFATVLAHAERTQVGVGELAMMLESVEGGIKGVVQAERALRRPPAKAPMADAMTVAMVATRKAMAAVPLATRAKPGQLVLLVARATDDGTLEVVGEVDDKGLTARAAAKIAD